MFMNLETLKRIRQQEIEKKQSGVISVCLGSGCLSSKSDQLKALLEKEIAEQRLPYTVKRVGCRGLCAAGPLVMRDDVLYKEVSSDKVKAIVKDIKEKKISESTVSTETPFFKKQKKIVLENSGMIDPESIEEYIGTEGYFALYSVLHDIGEPQKVVETIKKSGLRGRGGAGFPTGLKWELMSKSSPKNGQKFIVCNGDEGDPGAFMDRSVMEADPHRILEGMLIAGYAVGATNGCVYIRAEYPLAVKRVQMAIDAARKLGLLGKNILGSSFSFDLEVRLGAGAFVCGEETALMASIEGKRGNPRPRPPFPTESGLWGCPTMINNVETFANVPTIIRKGSDWFAAIGTEQSRGTKVFALTGHIQNAGLIEVPMGMTLREIVFEIGGGCQQGKKFKAVQTGGPSGGFITEKDLDTPIGYENLQRLGSIMGSGGMVVLTQDDCMVDVARFYLNFCVEESCGKCAPCRVGGYQMLKILEKILKGHGKMEDIDLLYKLCYAMQKASLCGLGQTAPNPVLSTLKNFYSEYIAYIEGGIKYARQKRQPAQCANCKS